MKYILHYAPDNASLIVRLALLELGLPFETRLVDHAAQELSSPAYDALAPTGMIPALEIGDHVMFETGAILLHLADTAGRMFPGFGTPLRTDALKWLFFIATTLHSDCRLHFYAERYSAADPAPATFAAATRGRLAAHLGLIDDAARKQPELFWQEGPTILTLYVLTICRWLHLYPEEQAAWLDLRRFSYLQDLAQQCERRPSAQTAAASEGLGLQIFSAPSHCTPPEGSPT